MVKRILAMLLVMTMVFSVLPTGVFAEGEGQQTQPAPQALTAHDDAQHKCEHCDAAVTWEKWGDDDAEKSTLPNGSDGKTHYYLVDNINTKEQTILESGKIVLCLNGKTVSGDNTHRAYQVKGASTVLTIVDCTAHTEMDGENEVYKAGKFTKYSSCAILFSDSSGNKATLNLYDGILTGNSSTGAGGAIRLQRSTTFNMYGGELSNNTAAQGGAVGMYGASTKLNIYGGIIRDNSATSHGGAIAAYHKGESTSNGTIKIEGTEENKVLIENNSVTGAADTDLKSGGAIFVNKSLTVKNAVIKGNSAAKGAAIFSESATTVITDSEFIQNTATSQGGALYVNDGSTEVTGTKMQKNSATSSGGTVLLKAGSLSLTSVQITESHADGLAGAIRADAGTLTLKDTTVTGATMGASGDKAMGAVYMTYKVAFIVKGQTRIVDNKDKKGNDANLFMYAASKTTTNMSMICLDPQDPLTGNAMIGVSMNADRWDSSAGGRYISKALGMTATQGEDVTKYFTSDNAERKVSYNGTADRLELIVKPAAPEHAHKICNDTGCQDGHGDVEFKKWESNNSLPTSGDYVLYTDVTLDDALEISSGELNICLNGYTIRANGKYLFKLDGTAKVSVTDCRTRTGNAGTVSAPNGIAVYMGKNNTAAVFNLYEGVITGCTSGKSGAAANIQGNGTFNMYGGEISGNIGGGSGTIYMADNAKFNAYGGTIQNNKAGSGGVFNLTGSGTELTVDGATITGNTATEYGGAIMAASKAKVNIVSGKITGNTSAAGGALYMSNKTTLTMTGGEISGNTSTDSGGAVYHQASTGTYSGGTISDNTADSKGGAVYACEGTEVNLNGCKITKNKAGSGGGIYATNADTVVKVTGSEVSENEATGSGGGMLFASGTVLNLSGGKICGNTASYGAGLYMSKKSTINMTGGEISGNTSTKSGGGVYHLETSAGNYTGGSITGNTTDVNGGGIYCNDGSTVMLGSVTITENTAAGRGAGVYVNENAVLTVTGEPVVQDNIANGKKNNVYLPGNVVMKLGTIGDNAKVGLNAAEVFRFISEANDTDYSKGFISDRPALQVEYKEKKLYLGASGTHAHCLCDSNAAGCDHGDILFAAWEDPNSLPTFGSWYLDTDVTLTAAVDMRDVTLNLCLNGHTVKVETADTVSAFNVKGAANLNISDCAENAGKITGATKTAIFGNNKATGTINLYNGIITGNSGRLAGAVMLQGNMVFNMYGGKIENNQKESASAGAGAINAYYGNVCVNIYGGEISGNKSTAVVSVDADGKQTKEGGNAGAIYAEGKTVQINLYGGTISGNHADVAGGAVCGTGSAKVNLLGTKLEGNTAGSKAGAVFVTDSAKLKLDGSELIGNSASYGGAVLVQSKASMEFTSGKISGNKGIDGAGVYTSTNTTFNMTGGVISGNIATGSGSGVYLLRSKAAVSGGEIRENTAKYGGGVMVKGGTLELKGGQIIKNTVTANGGAIKTAKQVSGKKTYYAKIVMSSGLISENTGNYGGGVLLEGSGCEMVLTGGEITKNTGKEGGGLYISTKTKFTMEGGKIANNSANNGGAALVNASTADFIGGELTGNTVKSKGGAVFVTGKNGVATVSGAKITKNKATYGGGLLVASKGKIVLKSGSVSGNTAERNGGGIYVSTNTVLDMYGGSVNSNTVTKYTGGGIYGLRSTLNLYGGSVSYNNTKSSGGGVQLDGATLNLRGASISYNTAVSATGKGGTGGAVRTKNVTDTKNGVKTTYKAKIVMTAGTIQGNKAGSNGGGICLSSTGASMNWSGGVICDNYSAVGGGIYVSSKTVFEMTGGECCRNEAETNGAGIWLAKNNEYAISNAKIYENHCGKWGAGVYVNQTSTCTFTDVEFSKNISTSSGGAVFCGQDAVPLLTRCTFTDNESTEGNGGAVYSKVLATLEDCVFTGNKAGENAGAYYCGHTSVAVNGFGNYTRKNVGISISGCTFENNYAVNLGGAACIKMSGFTEMKDSTFTGNSAGEAGSAIWAEEDLAMEDVTVTGNKGNEGVYAVYLAASEFDGQSYLKGTMKMSGNMIIRDNECGDLYLGEKTVVGTTARGYGEKTHMNVTLDSGVLTQRVYGAYNYEGGNCVYTITYGDRSLTDPEVDASLLSSADDAEDPQNTWLYVGVGAFVVAILAVAVVLLTSKKKKTAKEAVEE